MSSLPSSLQTPFLTCFLSFLLNPSTSLSLSVYLPPLTCIPCPYSCLSIVPLFKRFLACFSFRSSLSPLRLPLYLPSLACIPCPHSCLNAFLFSISLLGLFCFSFFPLSHSSFHVTSFTLHHSSAFLSLLLYFLPLYIFPYNFLWGVLRLHPPPFWTSILNHLRGTGLFAVTIIPSP